MDAIDQAEAARVAAECLYEETRAKWYKIICKEWTVSIARVDAEIRLLRADPDHELGQAWRAFDKAKLLYNGLRREEYRKP